MIGYNNFPKEYQALYDNLNSEYLLYCVKNGKEEEWNKIYDQYLDIGLEACGLNRDTTEYPELFSRKFETADGLFSQPLLMRPNLNDLKNPDDKKLLFKGLHLEGANLAGQHCRMSNLKNVS